MFEITVVTIFPEMFPGYLSQSLPGKALGKLWNLKTVDIRNFAKDKHKTVDDRPYGGGPGMVMKCDVVNEAMEHALSFYKKKPKILFMTPRGRVFNQKIMSEELMVDDNGLIILCGRYEGIDQRVIDFWKKEHDMLEISVGDFILFGGELPAMIVIETCLRSISGIMNNEESPKNESFSSNLLEHSHYTKPFLWKGFEVPEILISGNHAKIEKFRKEESIKITKEMRKDLLEE